jgi:heme exporter protein D
MQTLILLVQVLLLAMNYRNLQNQKQIISQLHDQRKRNRRQERRKRPRRHVVVKKTHEREVVRVTPTSSEFMQQQYKRVAEQYANK